MTAITDVYWQCGRCGKQIVPEIDGECTSLECARKRIALLETIALAAKRLVATLPKCDQCDAPATKAFARGEARYCDVHGPNVRDYPRAQPLRDVIAALDALEAKT